MLARLLLGLLLCVTGLARAQSTTPLEVTWGMSPWPGLVNIEDGQPRSGVIIDLLQQITLRLPEYQHRYSLVNLTRGFEQVKREPLSCFLPTFRTAERDQLGHYVSLFVAMPHQLLIRSEDRQRIAGDQAEVSLQQLLRDRSLRGGLIQDRSYGPVLDPLLQAPGAQPQLIRVQTSSAGNNLFDMLERGRVDYLLEYAEVIQFAQQQRQTTLAVTLLPLQEANTPFVSGIYCSKNAAGAELVRRIDQIARQPEVIEHFVAAQHAYVPAATVKHYQAWLDRFFGERPGKNLTSLP